MSRFLQILPLFLNGFSILEKIHKKVEHNVCFKILHWGTPQSFLVLSMILRFLYASFNTIRLKALINIVEFAQWRFMRV
jgi:hypothetical protein